MASTAPVCKACDDALVIGLQDDEAGAEAVPDDLELGCRCHFHWECLMEEASSVALSLKCPSCESYLPANEAGPSSTSPFFQAASGGSILARYINEGGTQDGLDILPALTEEAYVQNNPEARPARALHVMCAEADVSGIVELLHDVEGEVSDVGTLVRYQDPLADMTSGLHLAVEHGHQEVVWLLLWLASTMPTQSFPPPAREAAVAMGVRRLEVSSDGDVRGLRDGRGRTAEDVAQQAPDAWAAILEAGALSPP